MNSQVQAILNSKDTKLMPISKELADEIEALSKEMKTSTFDVVSTAIRILRLGLGRKVIINKPGSSVELEIPTLTQFPTRVKFEGEKND